MNLTRAEIAIVVLAAVYGVIRGAGNEPAFLVGSLLGAAVIAVVAITAKRSWQSA